MPTKISEFKAGTQRRAAGQGYDYFLPSLINDRFDVDSPALQTQLEKSALQIGELNAMARMVPDVSLFISSFVNNEAILSSRLEGTQTNLEDVFKKEENILPEKRDDWLEVRLYIEALEKAIAGLPDLPICNRLIQQAHGTLLSSGRGEHKLPGEIRRSQNWIGGSSIQTASFIPPHQQHVAELMGDLEKFLNEQRTMPDLILIGIAHYQFETIHPFLDGNGRIGRMLIVLFLVERGLLNLPLLYPSAFLEKHKSAYFDKLTRVRTENDLAGWLLFFLEGIEKTATFGIQTLDDILALKSRLTEDIRKHSGQRAANNLRAMDFAFKSPLFTSKDLMHELDVSVTTAYNVIDSLVNLGVFQKDSPTKRDQTFKFARYLDLFQRGFDD